MKRKIEYNYPRNEVVIKIQPKFDIQNIEKVSVQINADEGYLAYEWDIKSMSFGPLKGNNYGL